MDTLCTTSSTQSALDCVTLVATGVKCFRAKLMHKPQEPVALKIPDSRISSVKKVSSMRKPGDDKQHIIRDARFKAIDEDPAFQIDDNRDPHNTGTLI